MAIADQMVQQAPAAAGSPGGQQPAPQQQGPVEANPDAPPENDQAFVQGVNFARKVLYQNGGDQKIHDIVKTGQNASIDRLAQLAYDLTAEADKITNGMVQDENLMALGMYILNEIMEIAEASGAPIDDKQIASAFKQMILRYLQEQGVDTTQLEEAYGQLTPEDFHKLVMKIDEMVPEEPVPEGAPPAPPEGMPPEAAPPTAAQGMMQ